MQNDNIGKTFDKCPTCGKQVLIRSTRDKKAQYCSRICASNMRYRTRYKGSLAGPADRPLNPMDKTKF